MTYDSPRMESAMKALREDMNHPFHDAPRRAATLALNAADAVMFDDDAVGRVTEVLVAHQRRNSSSCLCGWAKLGASHPAHQGRLVIAALRDSPSGAGEPRGAVGEYLGVDEKRGAQKGVQP